MGTINKIRASNSSAVSQRVSDIASLVQADAMEPAAVLYIRADAISKLGQKQRLTA